MLTKGELDQATTRWAQGGVAAVLGGDPDSTDLHLADTLGAGAGLCDVDAVRVLVDEGPGRVTELIAMGAHFDRDREGRLLLAREGGHSMARVVHAGGAATGAEIERALVDEVRATAAAMLGAVVRLELIVEGGRCCGVRAIDADGAVQEIEARHVLLATGGSGQVFAATTNPLEATGDGLAMALRAGVACADVEFVQFHPTALFSPRMPRPLLSEALRGHGALIRDGRGERFVDELQPRDVVARAITASCSRTTPTTCSSTPPCSRTSPSASRPSTATSRPPGSTRPRDLLPIAPAAHYQCGGVVTDLRGATSLPGLWAAGEVTCTGVHGANRLASNSLLEGMVFGPTVIEAIERGVDGPEPTRRHACGAARASGRLGRISGRPRDRAARSPGPRGSADAGLEAMRDIIQREMTRGAGVLRSAASLEATRRGSTRSPSNLARRRGPRRSRSCRNLALCAAAPSWPPAHGPRGEPGAHTRTDFPELVRSASGAAVVGGAMPEASRSGRPTRCRRSRAVAVADQGRSGALSPAW